MIENHLLPNSGIYVPELKKAKEAPFFALQGTPNRTTLDRRVTNAIPFVGLEMPRQTLSDVGVGLYLPDAGKYLLNGAYTHYETPVVCLWRSMKMLERVLDGVGYVNRAVFTMAVWSGAPLSRPDTVYFPEMLGDQMRARSSFLAFRDELLNSGPSEENLDTMLTTLRDQKVRISIGELAMEAHAGRINPKNWIETLKEDERVRGEEQELLAEQRRQERLRQPVEPIIVNPTPRPQRSGLSRWLHR